jgi:hypothetical protein
MKGWKLLRVPHSANVSLGILEIHFSNMGVGVEQFREMI